MPRKKKKEEGPPGAPAWMMTFSDITTLLLTFFILIMTFSTIEKEKFERAKGSFKGALGVVTSKQERSRPLNESRQLGLDDRTRKEGAESPRRQLPEQVATELYELTEENAIQLDRSDRHWRVRMPRLFAFRPGSARPSAKAERLYRAAARVFRDYPNVLVVEGHADGAFRPSTEYPTAWDMAAERAAAVAEILVSEGMPAEQISIRSYGSTRPEVSNDTTLNRSRNRRVDILVLGAAETGVDR
jgi:chemotaxis protein MotB